MKFKTPTSVIVCFDNLYYVIIVCNEIIREESKKEYLPSCIKFYKNGEYVARIPEGIIESLEWFENSFSTVKTVVYNTSFKYVL